MNIHMHHHATISNHMILETKPYSRHVIIPQNIFYCSTNKNLPNLAVLVCTKGSVFRRQNADGNDLTGAIVLPVRSLAEMK